jgi:hypothetical protein
MNYFVALLHPAFPSLENSRDLGEDTLQCTTVLRVISDQLLIDRRIMIFFPAALAVIQASPEKTLSDHSIPNH